MQHVDHALELDGVDRPEGIAVEVRHDFDNACAAKSLEQLGVGMLATLLGRPQRKSNAAFDVLWKQGQVV